jgi:hypothetical protein
MMLSGQPHERGRLGGDVLLQAMRGPKKNEQLLRTEPGFSRQQTALRLAAR